MYISEIIIIIGFLMVLYGFYGLVPGIYNMYKVAPPKDNPSYDMDMIHMICFVIMTLLVIIVGILFMTLFHDFLTSGKIYMMFR